MSADRRFRNSRATPPDFPPSPASFTLDSLHPTVDHFLVATPGFDTRHVGTGSVQQRHAGWSHPAGGHRGEGGCPVCRRSRFGDSCRCRRGREEEAWSFRQDLCALPSPLGPLYGEIVEIAPCLARPFFFWGGRGGFTDFALVIFFLVPPRFRARPPAPPVSLPGSYPHAYRSAHSTMLPLPPVRTRRRRSARPSMLSST